MGDNKRLKKDELLDLHRAILKMLPLEGQRIGYHPVIKTAKTLLIELNKPLPPTVPPVTAGELNGALRALKLVNLTADVRLPSGKLGWQTTREGAAVVTDWSLPTFNKEGEVQ